MLSYYKYVRINMILQTKYNALSNCFKITIEPSTNKAAKEKTMDFSDQLKDFSTRILKLKESINTEEATKTSIVLPFFSLLGYDIFNPLEFVPEYTADTGTKKVKKLIMLSYKTVIQS